MIETKKIALSKLLKLETPAFLNEVIRILEKHGPEKHHLTGMYNLLLAQRENAKLLTVPYGAHPLTSSMDQLHIKRLSYAALLNTKLRSMDKPCFDEQENVKIARPLVRQYLSYLGQKSKTKVNMSINGFFLHLKQEPDVEQALIELGMQRNMIKLQEANIEHEKVRLQRLEDLADRPKVDVRRIEKEVQQVLRWFFDQVDSYQQVYLDVDYQPLINGLNEHLGRFSKLINTRATINKRKAKKAKDAVKKAAVEKERAEESKSKQSSLSNIPSARSMDAQPKPISVTKETQESQEVEELGTTTMTATKSEAKQESAIQNLIRKLKPPMREKG